MRELPGARCISLVLLGRYHRSELANEQNRRLMIALEYRIVFANNRTPVTSGYNFFGSGVA